jgi:hypothetical protein
MPDLCNCLGETKVGKTLFGDYYVKPTSSGIRDAATLFPKYGDYQELRRHGLKLAYWPGEKVFDNDVVMDLDWEWIRALRDERIGELRITNQIGGHRNLRIIFWVAETVLAGDPLPRIWTLSVVSKKANDWTTPELRSFRGRRMIVWKRNYQSAG